MNQPIMRPQLTDKQLLDQLRAGSSQGLDVLYRRFYPPIERFVVQNNGSQDQARDLFQETLLILLTNVREHDFELTSSLKTYVFAISKNLWLKQLKTSLRWTSAEEINDAGYLTSPPDSETPPTAHETVMAIFAKLTAHCVRLLSALFFWKKEIADIVQENGYTSVHSAQNQKYKCLQQARKMGKHASERTRQ